MSFFSDLQVLYHLLLKPTRGKSHAERMENFYGGQAAAYDSFRKKLLKGRQELYSQIEVPEGGVWVEMGGGTGSNLEYLGDKIHALSEIYIVDVSPSLLQMAQRRAAARGWSHVKTVVADAATWQASSAVDVVVFSYSLTMIPNWFAALDNAKQLLQPQGKLGVVDFYISRKFPEGAGVKHNLFTRSFWPIWFGCDSVYLSCDHLPYLQRHFIAECVAEQRAKLPYMPLIRVPYYYFIGRPQAYFIGRP